MGKIADAAGIQFRQLNSSKGPAVRSSRAQCDKNEYAIYAQEILKNEPFLSVLEAEVGDFCVEEGHVCVNALQACLRARAAACLRTPRAYPHASMRVCACECVRVCRMHMHIHPQTHHVGEGKRWYGVDSILRVPATRMSAG